MIGVLIAIISLAILALSLVLFFSVFMRERRTRAIEQEFPEFARSLSNHVSSGKTLESALLNYATLKPSPISKLAVHALEMTKAGVPFSDALRAIGESSKSRAAEQAFELMALASESGGTMGESLRKIAEEFWSAHIMKLERVSQSSGHRLYILIGGLGVSFVCSGVIYGLPSMLVASSALYICGVLTDMRKTYVALVPVVCSALALASAFSSLF